MKKVDTTSLLNCRLVCQSWNGTVAPVLKKRLMWIKRDRDLETFSELRDCFEGSAYFPSTRLDLSGSRINNNTAANLFSRFGQDSKIFVFISGADGIAGLQRKCDMFIRCFFVAAKLHHPFYIAASIIMPELPIFLSSLSQPTTPCPLIMRVGSVLSVAYINLSWMSNGLFVTFVLVSYSVSTLATMRLLG